MKINKLLLLLSSVIAVLLTGCGEAIPQNTIAIVVRTMGERSATNMAASAELYWARRLPFGISLNPGVKVFKFPLGLQDYSFTAGASYESPNNEPIQTDCLGGHLTFDINNQMYIDMKADNLAAKLLSFVNDHQLQSYSGESDMLSRWAHEKLLQFEREPLAQYTLGKQAIDVMKSKEEMNRILTQKMNERFNRYAIIFRSAGVTSEIRIPGDQKNRMNQIVMQEYANQALELREQKFMPLTNELVRIEQDGLSACQTERNRGLVESIKIEAEAKRLRRQMFDGLIGRENYIELEQMLTMVNNLEGGHTRIMIVPKTISYVNLGDEKINK